MTSLLTSAIQVSAILLIALSSLPFLRRKSAAVRHCVLSTAVVLALLIPVFNLVMPRWEIRYMPLQEKISAMTVPAAQAVPETAAQAAGSVEAPRTEPPSQFVSPLPGTIWSAGALVGLIVLFTGSTRLARIAAASVPVTDGPWKRLIAAIAGEYGVKRGVRLLQSRNSSILVTWGLVRPRIIVPAGYSAWPEERAVVVLRHELAHIRRCDWVVQMAAQALRIIYWFNPLVWIVSHRLRLESECACDDAVLSRDIKGPEYADHLLDLARVLNRPNRSWSAALTMARSSTIERRFSAMLNPSLNRYPVTRFAFVAVVLIGLCITLGLSAASSATPVPSPAFPEPEPNPAAGQTQQIAHPKLENKTCNACHNESAVNTLPNAMVSMHESGEVLLLLQKLELNMERVGRSQPSTDRVSPTERVSALDRALAEMAEDGEIADLEELIRAGANVNGIVPGNGSPLIAAAGDGNTEAVRYLLDRGADPNLVAPGEGTALIAAAGDGHLEAVRVLLDRGADIHRAVPGEGNALIAGAAEGNVAVVELLLDHGARIDDIVQGDENALIQASAEGHLDVVKLLVRRRADVNARVWVEAEPPWRPTGEWRTPLTEARREGHREIEQFMLSVGARE